MRHRYHIIGAALIALATLGACTSSTSDGSTTSVDGVEGTVEGTDVSTTAVDENAASTTTAESDSSAVVNAFMFQAPNRFSPLDVRSGGDLVAKTLIYDNLLTVNAEQEFEGRIAESWEFVDATTLTFRLRPDLRWSDGEPLTSEDVLFTYNLLANPASGSANTAVFANVVGAGAVAEGEAETVEGFSTPDAQTFAIELSGPNPGFLAQLAGSEYQILPLHVLGDIPLEDLVDHPYFNAPTVTSGPFTFVEYAADQFLELEANPNYWKDVGADRLFLHLLDSQVAIAQLETGELDIARVTPQDADDVAAAAGVEVLAANNPGYERIAINNSVQRFTTAVRQAFAHGIDRASIVQNLLNGHGEVVSTAFLVDGDRPPNLSEYEYDPARAQALLDDAGWDPSEPVRAMYIAGNTDREQVLQIVQAQLAEIGIQVDVEPVQGAEFSDRLADLASWDMVLYGGGSYAIDSATVAPILSCEGFYPNGGNIPQYCNEDLDELMKRASVESDPEVRQDLYQQAAAIENEDVPMIWIYRPEELWAHNSRIEGFVPNGDRALIYWNAADWRVTE